MVALILAGQRLPQRITFTIPAPLVERAKLKAKLHDDLFLSLANDEQNILDIKLDGEISNLESQLLKESE